MRERSSKQLVAALLEEARKRGGRVQKLAEELSRSLKAEDLEANRVKLEAEKKASYSHPPQCRWCPRPAYGVFDGVELCRHHYEVEVVHR